jgi:hypothetical protein
MLVTPGSATAGEVPDRRVTETGLWAFGACVAESSRTKLSSVRFVDKEARLTLPP